MQTELIRTNWIQNGLAKVADDQGIDLVRSKYYDQNDYHFLSALMWNGLDYFYKIGLDSGRNKSKMDELLQLHGIDSETGLAYGVE